MAGGHPSEVQIEPIMQAADRYTITCACFSSNANYKHYIVDYLTLARKPPDNVLQELCKVLFHEP